MKNPVMEGWYADPEAAVFKDTLYIYVTKSLPYEKQLNTDVIVSRDLEHFSIVSDILDMSTFPGTAKCVWAPTVTERDGRYYVAFSTNGIMRDDDIGGLYIGCSSCPLGPFRNVFGDGRPFIGRFYNGAQPIDPHFFKDGDDIYLYFGGWGHLNVCRMSGDMKGVLPIGDALTTDRAENTSSLSKPRVRADGGHIPDDMILEITPEGYHEAPHVIRDKEKYILMFSRGGWGNGSYRVDTAVSESPLGPFRPQGTVLSSSKLAEGPGHNSSFIFKGKRYIAYHRRFPGDPVDYHRVLCIDEMRIKDGRVLPVIMT